MDIPRTARGAAAGRHVDIPRTARGAAAGCHVDIPRAGRRRENRTARARRGRTRTAAASPRLVSPRNIHVAAAASPRLVSPRNIHVAAAASLRPIRDSTPRSDPDAALAATRTSRRSFFGENATARPAGLNGYLNASGDAQLQAQLYQCTLASALYLKAYIELRRSQSEIGHLVWQLNEIWPTGGWGSLEYGNVEATAGQIVGGRWKPTHYFYQKSLYKDVLATCGAEGPRPASEVSSYLGEMK